jgi:hypothetical protein
VAEPRSLLTRVKQYHGEKFTGLCPWCWPFT